MQQHSLGLLLAEAGVWGTESTAGWVGNPSVEAAWMAVGGELARESKDPLPRLGPRVCSVFPVLDRSV